MYNETTSGHDMIVTKANLRTSQFSALQGNNRNILTCTFKIHNIAFVWYLSNHEVTGQVLLLVLK